MAENDRNENAERVAELQSQVQALMNSKRKAEGDYHNLQEEVEEIENEARAAEERANKALAEVSNATILLRPRSSWSTLLSQQGWFVEQFRIWFSDCETYLIDKVKQDL